MQEASQGTGAFKQGDVESWPEQSWVEGDWDRGVEWVQEEGLDNGDQRRQGTRVCRGRGRCHHRPIRTYPHVGCGAGGWLSPDVQVWRSMWGERKHQPLSPCCSAAPPLPRQPPSSAAQHLGLCVAFSNLPFWLHHPVLRFLFCFWPPGHQPHPGRFYVKIFAPAAPSASSAFPSYARASKTSRPAPASLLQKAFLT